VARRAVFSVRTDLRCSCRTDPTFSMAPHGSPCPGLRAIHQSIKFSAAYAGRRASGVTMGAGVESRDPAISLARPAVEVNRRRQKDLQRMRINIDSRRCIASGACRVVAPAIFGEEDDGVVLLLDPHPHPSLHDAARAAAAACPAAVISVEED
jgi:ferredoxin